MKNITFSAQEDAIEKARSIALQRHTTLNEMFREWIDNLNRQKSDEKVAKKLQTLWKQTNYLRVGKKLTRDEMNDR